MNSFILLLFAFLQTGVPTKSNTNRLLDEVDDFSKLVALTCQGLAQDPWNPSLRQLWNETQAEIDYPEATTSLRSFRFRWHDRIPAWLWCAGLFSLSAWLAVDVYRKWVGRLPYPLLIPFILFCIGMGCFVFQIVRDRATQSFFRSPLVVLKETTAIRLGNSTLYPPRLPGPLPVGRALKVILDAGDWCQVEYAPGELGWIPQSAAIRVVARKQI